jgi:predicted Zn-dependent protease
MPSDTLKEAIQHLENGKLATAKTILDHLVKNEPDNPGIYHYLGSIALMQEKPDTAITLLKTAIDLKQDDYKFHEAMGQAYGLKAQQSGFLKASKAIKKSKNSFTKAIELNPKAVGSLEGLFMIYLFMPRIAGGDEKKAMQLIEEMNTIIPARGHSLRAFYFLKIKEVAKAEEEYIKAADLASDDAEIQMRVGHYFMNSDNPSMALEYFNHYIELKPKDPRGYEFKGDYFD